MRKLDQRGRQGKSQEYIHRVESKENMALTEHSAMISKERAGTLEGSDIV